MAIRPSRRWGRSPMATSRRRGGTALKSLNSISPSRRLPAGRWRRATGRYDAARDMLELYGAAKVPHWNRDSIARMLRRSAATVHLFEGHVGGGFGIRGELYPEDVLVCLAALRLARPVKWIEDRREH